MEIIEGFTSWDVTLGTIHLIVTAVGAVVVGETSCTKALLKILLITLGR
jgi:hypothetical protein